MPYKGDELESDEQRRFTLGAVEWRAVRESGVRVSHRELGDVRPLPLSLQPGVRFYSSEGEVRFLRREPPPSDEQLMTLDEASLVQWLARAVPRPPSSAV